MCTEIYLYYKRCGHHSRRAEWKYCSLLLPREQTEQEGLVCRKYKCKVKKTRDNSKCYECTWQKLINDALNGLYSMPAVTPCLTTLTTPTTSTGKKRRSWLPRWFQEKVLKAPTA